MATEEAKARLECIEFEVTPQVQPIDILSLLPPKDEGSYYPDEYADGYAEGWNACIDKIVEMYGKQVE